MSHTPLITVGELVARFLEACGVKAAFGVISIHNMPILDAFHTRGQLRFVSARGEAGACNMADAYARVSGVLGVCVTSTGTGCGNAAGAMVEVHRHRRPGYRHAGAVACVRRQHFRRWLHPHHGARVGERRLHGQLLPLVRHPGGALRLVLRPAGPVGARLDHQYLDAAADAGHGAGLLVAHQP